MKYNICLVRPKGYIHSDAFLELAQVIAYSMEDLGYQVSIQYHKIDSNSRNIILGCHLLEPDLMEAFPKDSIVINTEQIFSDVTQWSSNWTEIITGWAGRFETWDYSTRNIDKFSNAGIKGVKHLKIGYHSKLTRIPKNDIQDIDVLFYGSINKRRQVIINDLKREGCCVKVVSGVYGNERDKFIARSKLVLNLHYYNSQIFEVIRVFYLMANKKAVVSEVNDGTSIDPNFTKGICSAPYDQLVSACVNMLENFKLRANLEISAIETISNISQVEILRELLE